MKKLKLLHVGCGPKTKKQTTNVFNNERWDEIRFDVNSDCNPDVTGSMVDMHMFEDNTFDAIFSSHNFEHLFFHEAEKAANEFFRVLNPTGYVFLLCPDIISVCEGIVKNGPDSLLYKTASGMPISPIDVIYGHRPAIKNGNEFMAHKYGYSEKTLTSVFKKSGFSNIATLTRKNHYDIVLIACREKLYNGGDIELNNKNMRELFTSHFK
mgnify:FL=1|tara:strand:- start:9177 stop:9806 length:630 start_codon:yes stop_codon:yes gene_type:complete